MKIELPYTPQPRQLLLHQTLASEILYGGAAGGGKSHSIRWDGYDFCLKNPGCVAVLVRQTLPQLEKNHIRKVRAELPKELGDYNETRKVFRFWNGSLMAFQHLEYDKDINDFQGDEIHWLGIDEAALLKPEHLAEIKTRLRLGSWNPTDPESIKRLPRLVMGSNPGGPSHLWLKQNFVDPAPPETIFENIVHVHGKDIVKTRIFIPATMRDNDYLDDEYEAQFGELPEWKQQQLRDGDWNVVPGAFFDCWNPKTHIIEPFEVPDWWPKYRSCDWGFATPFSIGEWTVSDGTPVLSKSGTEITYPEGCLIRIWEWYGAEDHNNKGLRLDPALVAQKIISNRGKCSAGPGDPSMWRADSGPSFAEKFARAGLPFFKADNQRIAGWQEMYRRLSDNMLLVVDTCHDFIRTIPSLAADPMNPDDILKVGEDHVGDDCRYMCMARPMQRDKPKPRRPSNDPIRFSDLVPFPKVEQNWI